MHTDQIKDILHYDPGTGAFTWKVDRNQKAVAGSEAGHVTDRGYRYIEVNGKSVRAHRLAFFFQTGKWPPFEVDHINGDKLDNRWDNLRLTDRRKNMQNQRRAHSRNSSGFLGVSRNNDQWRARIRVNGKSKHVGYYSTPEEAHEAYLKAKRELHQGCTI